MSELYDALKVDFELAMKGTVRRTLVGGDDVPTLVILVYRADKADEAVDSAIETAREVREGEIPKGGERK